MWYHMALRLRKYRQLSGLYYNYNRTQVRLLSECEWIIRINTPYGYDDFDENIYPIRVFVKREYRKCEGWVTCGREGLEEVIKK